MIGVFVVDGMYAGDIRTVERQNQSARSKLRVNMFTSDDREVARDENDALLTSFETLADAVGFKPRPEFDLKERAGSARTAYMTPVDTTTLRATALRRSTPCFYHKH